MGRFFGKRGSHRRRGMVEPNRAPVIVNPWVGLSKRWVVALLIGPTVLAFALSSLLDLNVHTGPLISGSAKITDGDTLRINGQRIRLHGIDAPEGGQRCKDSAGAWWRCGNQAARNLSRKTDGRSVSCRGREHDRYGRLLAVCDAGGEDLNAWMVRQGWAVAYTRYSFRYVVDEVVARVADRGIWSGDFVLPEEWRRQNRR
jgi:endonuclease YncB( thermonuclease family)